MEKSIRLILVDDHDVVRTGVKTYLERQSGLQVVGEASSGEQAIAISHDLNPDVIVMDITMPGMDGLEATRHIKTLCPDCRVLALTVHEDKQYFFEMLAAGASGYIT
ncbi:MAG TPA: response regulator transcription factor, partial [Anaerolineales bacterium]